MLLGILATLSPPAGGLPFGTRGAHSDEGAEAVTDPTGSKIEILFPSSSKDRRNAVLENFFADSETHSTALKEEIKSQASNLTDFLTTTRRTLHVKCQV